MRGPECVSASLNPGTRKLKARENFTLRKLKAGAWWLRQAPPVAAERGRECGPQMPGISSRDCGSQGCLGMGSLATWLSVQLCHSIWHRPTGGTVTPSRQVCFPSVSSRAQGTGQAHFPGCSPASLCLTLAPSPAGKWWGLRLELKPGNENVWLVALALLPTCCVSRVWGVCLCACVWGVYGIWVWCLCCVRVVSVYMCVGGTWAWCVCVRVCMGCGVVCRSTLVLESDCSGSWVHSPLASVAPGSSLPSLLCRV